MTIQEDFSADIQALVEGVGSTHRELAEAIAKDTKLLVMQALNGEDVDSELQQVKAQAANLGAVVSIKVSDGLMLAMGKVLQTVVKTALVP